jgi:hypothetical protein
MELHLDSNYDGLHVFRAFSVPECEDLISILDRYHHLKLRNAPHGRIEVPIPLIAQEATLSEPELIALVEMRDFIISAVRKVYTAPAYPDLTLYSRMLPLDQHELHADNERLVEGQWLPNHTPFRQYTALLYLDTCGVDFTGGEIAFPNHYLTLPPEAGMLIMFPSDRRYVHRVFPVESGVRRCVAVWFTDQAHLYEQKLTQVF